MDNNVIIAIGYFIIGLPFGAWMAYNEGDGLWSSPVLAGFIGMVAWPVVIMLLAIIVVFVAPFMFLFTKAAEWGDKRRDES